MHTQQQPWNTLRLHESRAARIENKRGRREGCRRRRNSFFDAENVTLSQILESPLKVQNLVSQFNPRKFKSIIGGSTLKTHLALTMAEKRIPEMEFINDVEEFMKEKEVTPTLQGLDERLQKYRFLEINLLQKRGRLRRQLPDFEKSIEVITLLEAKKELQTHFLMSSQLYSKARIPPTDTVCLWLGANVMLEYPLEEAKALLAKNLSTSLSNLKQIEEDLEFLRDQITTSEVNLARVYNWNVKKLQAKKAAAGAIIGGASKG